MEYKANSLKSSVLHAQFHLLYYLNGENGDQKEKKQKFKNVKKNSTKR